MMSWVGRARRQSCPVGKKKKPATNSGKKKKACRFTGVCGFIYSRGTGVPLVQQQQVHMRTRVHLQQQVQTIKQERQNIQAGIRVGDGRGPVGQYSGRRAGAHAPPLLLVLSVPVLTAFPFRFHVQQCCRFPSRHQRPLHLRRLRARPWWAGRSGQSLRRRVTPHLPAPP